MERARGGVPSVGVVKRRVLRGLWRRLVGVGIIGPGLLGAPAQDRKEDAMDDSSYWYIGVSPNSIPHWSDVTMYEAEVGEDRVAAPPLKAPKLTPPPIISPTLSFF